MWFDRSKRSRRFIGFFTVKGKRLKVYLGSEKASEKVPLMLVEN